MHPPKTKRRQTNLEQNGCARVELPRHSSHESEEASHLTFSGKIHVFILHSRHVVKRMSRTLSDIERAEWMLS